MSTGNNAGNLSMSTICVFCGSSAGHNGVYTSAAEQLGDELVRREMALVYGGGSVGLMGTIAHRVAAGGRPVTGILPRALQGRELAGDTIGTLHLVDSMLERKQMMTELSHAFVAMPGGFGTMDELFEVITWGQLGIQSKPIGLLNTNGYWDPITAWIDHAVAEGFIRERHRDLIVVADDPVDLLDQLLVHEPPTGITKWLNLKQT